MLHPGLDLAHDGALHLSNVATEYVPNILEMFAILGPEQAGVRLVGVPGLVELLVGDGPIGKLVIPYLGAEARPVRAIFFDKNDTTNWALGWHQDRTIAVQNRADAMGFGPWTVKQGLLHVMPPMSVLESMITIRVHLDQVPEGNAPLMVALGTHRLGKLGEAEIASAVERSTVHICTARAGDVWVYCTPILHASDRAAGGQRRRVLQVDYAATALPDGLEWLGV